MISIIVPLYNAEKYLHCCLDSIVKQTYKELEIILVNDGSTDSSLTICEQYKKKDDRIKILSKENGGQMSAWILGVKESTGEYIGFVDSDDYIEQDMYEKMFNTMSKYNADVVMCGRSVFDRYEEKISTLPFKEFYSAKEIEEIHKLVFPDLGMCISQARWDKLFKRDIIVDNMNLYCQKVVRTMEDRFIVSSAMLSTSTFATINEPLYHCRLVNNSSSKKPRPELFDIAELLYSTQEKMLIDKGLYEKYQHKLETTRLDYLKMIVIRNIARKNGYSFTQKKAIAKKMLTNANYSNAVLANKEQCTGKFGKFIYLAYRHKNPILLVVIAKIYGAIFERENKNGF